MSKRILAVKWRQLGDTILWTAALQALKEWDPAASLDLALPTPYLPLFANDDRFDQLWGLDQERKSLPPLKGRLKERKYDIVLNFHAGPRSRALCRGANGALCLIHHHARSRKRFGSHLPIVGLGQPAAATERDLNVVRTLGWNGKSPPSSLRLPPEWAETARRRWRSAGRSSKPLLLIGASASRPAKQWPLEYFCQLGAMLAPTWDVVLAYESESCFNGRQWQRAELSRHLQLIHTPQLCDLAGLTSLADMFVGGDSGVKHLAVALGVRTVTLFGPESVGEWHGYDLARHAVIQKEVACRDQDREGGDPAFAWCGALLCPLSSHACLTLISAEEVAKTIEKNRPTGI